MHVAEQKRALIQIQLHTHNLSLDSLAVILHSQLQDQTSKQSKEAKHVSAKE